MHKQIIKYYDPIKKQWLECEADTFDTVVHMNRGTKHALADIEQLLKEEEQQNKVGTEEAEK